MIPLTENAAAELKSTSSRDLVVGGFQFRNPKAGGSCGCGTSFRV